MQDDPSNPPAQKPPKIFGPKAALLIFGANLGVQLFIGFWYGFAKGFYEGFQMAMHKGLIDKQALSDQVSNATMLPVGVFALIAGGYAAFRVARRYFPGSIRDGAMAEIGLNHCPLRDILIAAGAGAGITLLNLIVLMPMFPPDAHNHLGPVAIAAASSGLNRLLWSGIAILLAPPCEEFLFRGVLYSGFIKRWSQIGSAVLVSVMFVSLHLVEVIGYLPALIGISMLAAATLYARVRTGSLLAPLALHMSYNFVLIFFVHVVAKM